MEKILNKDNWPSYEEYKKVEGSMSPEEKTMSKEREATYKAGAKEEYPLTPEKEKIEYFKEKFPNPISINFKNKEGGTYTSIDNGHGFDFVDYRGADYILVSTEEEADKARKEIIESLMKDKWEKNYICADNKLAKYLLNGIVTNGYRNNTLR